MSEQVFKDVFEGVPKAEISLIDIKNGISILDALFENPILKILRRS